MKFDVIQVTEEKFNEAIPMPAWDAGQQEYKEAITAALEKADSEGADEVNFQSVTAGDKPSDTFQKAMWIQDAILGFAGEDGKPERVNVVCTDESVCETYKVVYNFYYASTKATRLDDDKWD